jgi:translocator protein
LYTIQLGLNLAWMPLFFGLERPIEATVDVLALLGTTSYLTYIWSKVDEVAAWTMVPYLGWICFATYLCVRRFIYNFWPIMLTTYKGGMWLFEWMGFQEGSAKGRED